MMSKLPRYSVPTRIDSRLPYWCRGLGPYMTYRLSPSLSVTAIVCKSYRRRHQLTNTVADYAINAIHGVVGHYGTCRCDVM